MINNKMDININLFWLSDIHYKTFTHKNKKIVSKYLKSFISYARKLSNEVNYDYLVISGDIANWGDKKEYELFKTDILEELLKVLNYPQVIAVPGNHDVDQKAIIFKEEFIKSIIKNPKNKNRKKDFLKDNASDFTNNFRGYSEFFDKFYPNSLTSDISKNKNLFGYLLNKKDKTLFILLNSALYSVGKSIIKEYIENNIIANEINKKNSICKARQSVLKDIALENDLEYNSDSVECFRKSSCEYFEKCNKKYIGQYAYDLWQLSSEYGTQLLGLEVFKESFNEMQNIIETYNDFLIVTIMHHPINWLELNERVHGNNQIFDIIRNNTDLMLTGHEHVSTESLSEYINEGQLLHIQAGQFLGDPKRNLFEDFWFSTISINVIKRTVNQKKHINKSEGNSNFRWYESENQSNRKLRKIYSQKLSRDRFNSLNINNIYFFKLINALYGKSIVLLEDSIFISDTNIYINVLDHSKIFNVNSFIVKIKNMVAKNNIKGVYFFCYDLESSISEQYLKEGSDKLKVLEKIKNDFDFKFDCFRNLFFSNLSDEETIQFSELYFINKIIPYWIFESYIVD